MLQMLHMLLIGNVMELQCYVVTGGGGGGGGLPLNLFLQLHEFLCGESWVAVLAKKNWL